MSQIHLAIVNATADGINMMVSWVRENPSYITTYNIIPPIIGTSIITIIAGMCNYRRKEETIFDCYVYDYRMYNFSNRDSKTCGFCCVYFILFICCVLSGIQLNPIIEQLTYCNIEDKICSNQSPITVTMLSSSKTVYSAPLYNLSPKTKYNYLLSGSGTPIQFTTLNPENPRVAFIGDFGYENAVAFKALYNTMDEYDMIIHVGDIAYDLNNHADDFMHMIEPISSIKPYMTTPGNHEAMNNFTYYKALFNNPRLFYSFNIGSAHFISFSSEFLFNPQLYSNYNVMEQYKWLQHTLRENINATIKIAYAHRPMYCSLYGQHDRCIVDTEIMRKGMSYDGNTRIAPLEELLHKYGIDIYFAGHIHSYERTKPMYDKHNSIDIKGIVHILNGVGGSREGLDQSKTINPSWLAYHNTTYGFGILNIKEKDVNWRQYATSKDGNLNEIDKK